MKLFADGATWGLADGHREQGLGNEFLRAVNLGTPGTPEYRQGVFFLLFNSFFPPKADTPRILSLEGADETPEVDGVGEYEAYGSGN